MLIYFYEKYTKIKRPAGKIARGAKTLYFPLPAGTIQLKVT